MDCLVGRYALHVVYYIAESMFYSTFKAFMIAADNRPLYFMLEALHACDERAAKMMSLPTSLVKRRKWRALTYCSLKYFDFICLVDSIFSLSLKAWHLCYKVSVDKVN